MDEFLRSTYDDPFDTSVVADLEEEYEILGELGRGGSAIVYRGRDRVMGREVAIKVVPAGRPFHLLSSQTGQATDDSGGRDDPIARLAREARTVAKLHHQNIVSVYAIRRLREGALALVMQLVPGRTLKEVIRDEGALPPDRAERVLRDIGRALAFAHARGVVHRDVKPENIFLDAQHGRWMLADFGIARIEEADTRLTQTGTTLGTPAYMSPEQIGGGPLDGRADLYSLGLVGWEMLTGRQPWEGLGLYELLSRQKGESLAPIEVARPSDRGEVTLKLQYVVERMMQKNAGARWASADAMLAQLDHAVLPGDYSRWLGAHKRRVEVAKRAETARKGVVSRAGGLMDAALATVRFTRQTPAPVAPADPEWGAQERTTRPTRFMVGAAVIVGVAGAGFFALKGTPRPDLATLGARDSATGRVEVPAVVRTTVADSAPVLDSALASAAHDTASIASAPSMVPAVPATAVPIAGPAASHVTTSSSSAPVAALSAPVAVAPVPNAPAPNVAAANATASDDDAPAARAPITIERGTIAAGGRHTCALAPDGRASCWGANDRGQLGEDDADGRASPGRVSGDLAFAQIAAGVAHTCGVTRGGDAYCWGNDEHGELGDATTSTRDAPVHVAGGYRFKSVRTGLAHTCGVTSGGLVACWGSNADGQLGDGSSANHTTPSVVAAGSARFATVTAGWRHSCALSVDGVAFCWGANDNGQLGDGTRTSHRAPTPVGGGLRFVSIAAGSAHTCGVTTTRDVYCWGRNTYGQLGLGGGADRATPTKIDGIANVTSVVAGSMHTCALASAGVWCWGRNVYGQLGDGSTTDRGAPARVAGSAGYVALSASGAHTCAASDDGSVACWGYNVEGQVGDGTRNHRATPTKIDLP